MTFSIIIDQIIADPAKIAAATAVASLIIATCAVVLSVISTIIAVQMLRSQRKHNRLTVRPLAFVAGVDYENKVAVRIWNNGIGPMIIRSVQLMPDNPKAQHLIERMPELPDGFYWSAYSTQLDNRALRPGDRITLLQLDDTAYADDRNTFTSFEDFRNEVRRILSAITVVVEYTDVYGHKMPATMRRLDWFGRHSKNNGIEIGEHLAL